MKSGSCSQPLLYHVLACMLLCCCLLLCCSVVSSHFTNRSDLSTTQHLRLWRIISRLSRQQHQPLFHSVIDRVLRKANMHALFAQTDKQTPCLTDLRTKARPSTNTQNKTVQIPTGGTDRPTGRNGTVNSPVSCRPPWPPQPSSPPPKSKEEKMATA